MNILWILIIILIIAAPFALWYFRDRIQKLLGRSGNYRNVEKNVFVDMPEQMPKEWASPKGAKVHADSQPKPWEFQIIDEAIARQITRFNQPFKNFLPADTGQKAKGFKKHSDYRIWLLEHKTSVVGAETEEIKGFPIIRTHNSATGYASGITAGVQMLWGGGLKLVYPFIVTARLTGEWAENARAREFMRESLQNEIDHLLSSADPTLYLYFTGENDIHPFEW